MVSSRETLRTNLKRYRKKYGLRQAMLAAKSGMSTREYGKIERGQVNPSLQTLDQLAVGTGLTAVQLLTEDFFDEEEPQQ